MMSAAILACLLPPPDEPSWLYWGETRVLFLRISFFMRFLVRVGVYSDKHSGRIWKLEKESSFYTQWDSVVQANVRLKASPVGVWDSRTLWQTLRSEVSLDSLTLGFRLRGRMWPPWLGSWPSTQCRSICTKRFVTGRQNSQLSQILLTVRGTRGEFQKGHLGYTVKWGSNLHIGN